MNAEKKKPAQRKQDLELTFEQALERLEKVVEEMEGPSLSLEEMTGHFEEGTRLVKFCNARLNEVERKIEKLVKKEGEVTTEAFEPEEESGQA